MATSHIKSGAQTEDASSSQWTQDEAVAYECARDCITHLISCYVALADAAERRGNNKAELQAYEEKIESLALERKELTVKDTESIRRIRNEYGELIQYLSRPLSGKS